MQLFPDVPANEQKNLVIHPSNADCSSIPFQIGNRNFLQTHVFLPQEQDDFEVFS